MARVAGSAVAVRQIKAETAVDLGADGWIREARRRRALTGMAAEVELEVGRLVRRASWLRRKAARLGVRANGRAVALSEATACDTLARILPQAQQGQPTPMFAAPDGRHLSRAIRLLRELQTAE